MNIFEKEIISILKKETSLEEISLEIPPNPDFGDYAFPCFELAKKIKKNPNEIAQDLTKEIKLSNLIRKVEVKGPYLNFFVNKVRLAEDTIKGVLKEKEKYGFVKDKKKTIMVEYSQPNTNKPQHLGHVRNNVLGMVLSNILEFANNKVIKVNLINDRGIHICKSMIAYQKWGKNKNPNSEKKKGDHFVGDFYVLYNKKLAEDHNLEKEAHDLLVAWEKGDKKVIELWKKMNSWVIEGFDETYKRLGIEFDKVYYESELYKEGKKIILDALKKGIAKKNDEGAIYIDLSDYGLGEKILIRADGTSIYITQDIYLAVLRHEEYKLDKLIYVVASEQNYHFKALFKILELFGYKWAKDCYHLSYGMIYLPEGKMKSREGKVVDADDLMDEMINLARKEVLERHKGLPEKEIEKRALQIGLGAIKFYIIKHDPMKDMTYNPDESIKFEGETGPYVQYAHTRICSILEKASVDKKADYSLLKDELELKLVTLLSQFPEKIEETANSYKPSTIANYLMELAQAFNSFYTKLPVIKAEKGIKEARLHLIMAVKQVLKIGLNLLGIEAPERM